MLHTHKFLKFAKIIKANIGEGRGGVGADREKTYPVSQSQKSGSFTNVCVVCLLCPWHARGTAEMCSFLCSAVASDDNLVYLVGGETCDNPKPRMRSLEVFDMEQPEKNTFTVEDVLPVGNDQMRNKHDNLY